MKQAISLFSGLGGDSLGMKNAGLNVVAYSEKNQTFCKSHDANFPDADYLHTVLKKKKDGDITKIPDEIFLKYANKIEVIFAGFPCQGFSNAGKKMENDPRNTLFKEFVRATRLIKPNYIIGENVKGLLTRTTGSPNSSSNDDEDEEVSDTENETTDQPTEKKKYIDIIENEFKELGYKVKYKVLKTDKYGVPQKRERLIILGVREELNKEIDFPPEETTIPNLVNIVKFSMKGAIKVSKEQFDFEKIPSECILKDLTNEETENNPHPYLKLKLENISQTYNRKEYKGSLVSFGKRDSPLHCEIIDIRNPSKTIICTYEHQPRLFVPLKNKNGYFLRCLLPDELKQIQGFPEDYILCGNTKEQIVQIGNAVPPPLIEKIVKNLHIC